MLEENKNAGVETQEAQIAVIKAQKDELDKEVIRILNILPDDQRLYMAEIFIKDMNLDSLIGTNLDMFSPSSRKVLSDLILDRFEAKQLKA